MPKVKNGRQKKNRLVVAMRPVAKSPKSRLQKSRLKNKNEASDLSAVGIEIEVNVKGGKTLRSTRNKPAKFADEDSASPSPKKAEKPAKQQQQQKGKTKVTQKVPVKAVKKAVKQVAKPTKSTKKSQTGKRKALAKSQATSAPAKKRKTTEKPESEILTEIDYIGNDIEADMVLIDFPQVTKSPSKTSKAKAKTPVKRKKAAPKLPKSPKPQKIQVVEEIVQEEHVPIIIKREDEEEDEIEEDDEDMDDSLFFGLPPEHVEHPSPLVNCSHCKRKFKKEDLPDHMASCPERYVQCRECGKVLSNLQTLERHHKRFHLKLREVPCTLCDKMFIDEAAARKHLKTVHFKVKNFHCPHCDKSFSQRNKLTYHVRTHSGEKPFACTECGRSFSLLWNLKTHLRTHTGEKPYACDVCGRKFTQKQNMTSHMTTHKKPKISKSAYAGYHGASSDGSEYFSSSTLHDLTKSGMLQKSYSLEDKTSSQTRSLQQNINTGQYLLDSMANMVSTTHGVSSSVASMVQNSGLLNLENGLGLLSAVARKGDSQEQPGNSVQVDGIISMADQASSSQGSQAAAAGLEQVVEVLIQATGGQSEDIGDENASDIGNRQEVALESQEVLGDLETHIIAQDQRNALSQQGATQTVIPIGNANLSGLANILQNPEVLAAINAAAASNKFIVIGPVGMLSGHGASSVNAMSNALPHLGPGSITVGTDDEGIVMSTGIDAAGHYVMHGMDNQISVSDINTNVSSSIQVEVSSVQDRASMILPNTSVTTSTHTSEMSTSEAVNVVNTSIEPLVTSGITTQESSSVSSVISSDVGADIVSSGHTYSAVPSQASDMSSLIQSSTAQESIVGTQIESYVSSVTMSNPYPSAFSGTESMHVQSSSVQQGLEIATSSENFVSSGCLQANIHMAESSEDNSNISQQREAVTSFNGDMISESTASVTMNEDAVTAQNVGEEVSSSGDRGNVQAYPAMADESGSTQIHLTASAEQSIVQQSSAVDDSLASSADNIATNSTDVEKQTVQSSIADTETFQSGADSTNSQGYTNEAVTSETHTVNQPDDVQGLHVTQTVQPNNSNIEEVDVSHLSSSQVIQLDLSTAAALQASGLMNTTQSLVMMTNDGTSYTVTLPEGFVNALSGIQSDVVSGITTSSNISSSIQTVDTTQGSGGIQSVSVSQMPVGIDNGVSVEQDEITNSVSSGSNVSGNIDAIQGSRVTGAYSTVFQEANKAADHDLAVMQEPEQIDSSDSSQVVTNSSADALNQNDSVSGTDQATGVTSSVENVGMVLSSDEIIEHTTQEEDQISTSAQDVN